MGFTEAEFVYEHSVEFRTALMKRLQEENLQGLCVAWAIDWLKHNLTNTPVNTIYSPAQINQLIEQHKDYITGRDLAKYAAKEGVSLQSIASGDVSYHGGIKELDDAILQPGHAYLLQIGEPFSPVRNTIGHVFGLFRTADMLEFFDQNYGMTRVANFERLNEVYTEEIQLFEDDLNLKFRHWELFRVTLAG